jgi:flagellar hook-associated protein 2
MSTTSSAIFSGSSRFSTDFQNVVTRAVQIASLPLTQMNNDKTTLTSKQTAYTSLAAKFTAVRQAMNNLASVAASNYTAASDNTSIATVATSTGATDGSYQVVVTQAGSYSQYLSLSSDNAVADPSKQNLAAGTSFNLTIDGITTPLTVSDGSLSGLALAINQANAGAHASIVNIGSPTSPNYILSVTGTKWDAQDIELTTGDGLTTLLGTRTGGQQAQYTINGLPSTPISTSSPTVTLSPGVTATLQPKTGNANVTVSRNTSALTNALQSVVTAYNNAVTELNKYHGENAGVLQGDSQISTLANDLRSIIHFQSGQAVNTLGFQFDQNGVLSVDTSKLASQSSDVVSSFLGDGTSAGFIKNADSILDSITNDLLPSVQSTLSDAVRRKQDQIDETQDRIDQLQKNLNAKMAAADALVASLEQNVSYFQSMFAQQQVNAQAYK